MLTTHNTVLRCPRKALRATSISLRVSQESSDSLMRRGTLEAQAQGLPQEFVRKSDDIFQGPFGVILLVGNQLFAKETHHKQSLVRGSLIRWLTRSSLQKYTSM